MMTGRETLGSIDQALTKGQQQIADLQEQIGQSSDALLAQRRLQGDDYRSLAKVRLDHLADSELINSLDDTEQRVKAMLSQREAAFQKLKARIAEHEGNRRQLEIERQQQAAELDRAVAIVDEAEAKTQARLGIDPSYQDQRVRTEESDRKAIHAGEKASRSEAELDQKGESYRNDPLFTYLWERHHGLPQYKAGSLTRWLDGKVARLIGYAEARVNYARLNEIPKRLREHADHLRKLADAEFAKLRERDQIARAEDGIPALEEQLATEQRQLDEVDARLAQNEEALQSLLSEQAGYLAGDDEHMRAAVEFLVHEFTRDDLIEIRQDAINTPYPEDDLIVSQLLQRENEMHQLEAGIEGLRTAIDQQQQRLVEMEKLRVEFKRNRYDRAGSVFANDSVIPMLLGQFLAGMLDRRMLWKVLQEQQSYRPDRSDPGFGSGGFGRGTVWNGGLGDLSDIIGDLGRGGFGGSRRGGGLGGRRSGGGGFRTGGGF